MHKDTDKNMTRVNKLIGHPLFIDTLKRIDELETDRIFCRHGLSHLLDVARMMYIENLEQELGFSKDLIYAAALLHDLGRADQYLGLKHHEEASADIAGKILPDCDFSQEESSMILKAIRGHRGFFSDHPSYRQSDDFSALLQRMDKESRICIFCQASEDCYWPKEKKNRTIDR